MSFCVKKIFSLLWVALGPGSMLLAQQPDSVIALTEVAIVATPVRQVASSTFNETISPSAIARFGTQSLSELLVRSSSIGINQYGPGALATVSLRGAGSAQTAILWNGINLQSPMNGGVSLSQIPVHFVDEIEVNHGGQSAQKGGSAIGGVVEINNRADYPRGFGLSVIQSAGSFGQFFSGIKIRYGGEQVSFSTRLFRQSATNDFPFVNTALFGQPLMNQPNAQLLQYGLLQTAFWQVKPGQQLVARVWAQHYDKNLPPLMTNLNSLQNQVDDDYRVMAEWKGVSGRYHWNLRSGYIYNKQIYADAATSTLADNRASSWQNNFEGLVRLTDRHAIVVQSGTTFETGHSDNYTTLRRRNITWLMAGYRLSLTDNKVVVTASVREELADLKTSTPTFSLGADIALNRAISLHSNFARSYRLPTLNDLYWNIWGNPCLKPEEGFTADLGLNFSGNTGKWHTTANLTAYSNLISNWIIWLPKGIIWTPENLKKVWSRGLETQASIAYTHRQFGALLVLKYQHTRASQVKSGNLSPDSKRQLIYQPFHKATGSLTLNYKSFDIHFSQSYTGIRYSDEANLRALDPYSLSDVALGTHLVFKSLEARISLKVNNIFNQSFQTIAWYAMPGRNYEIGINIAFNHSVL